MRRSDLVVGRTYTGDEAREAVEAGGADAVWLVSTEREDVLDSGWQPWHVGDAGETWTLVRREKGTGSGPFRVVTPAAPTLPPEPPDGFVRVRVGICVSADGSYVAAGQDGWTDGQRAYECEWPGLDGSSLARTTSYVEADVPLPTVAAVAGVCDDPGVGDAE